MKRTTVVNLKNAGADAIYIGRAGRGEAGTFGNPFKVSDRVGDRYLNTREEAIMAFKCYFYVRVEKDLIYRQRMLELAGKQLACPGSGCGDGQPCHGDVIAEWVNFMAGAK